MNTHLLFLGHVPTIITYRIRSPDIDVRIMYRQIYAVKALGNGRICSKGIAMYKDNKLEANSNVVMFSKTS